MIYISAVGMINALGNSLDEIACNLTRGVAPGMRPRAGWLQGQPQAILGGVDGELPAIGDAFAAHRSRNNQLLLAALAQIQPQVDDAIARYGRDQAAVVMSNHWGRVYMPGISDERSLKTLSELIGRDEMHTVSWSTDTWGRMNTSRSSHEVEVAPVADLKTMKADETIVIMGRHKPARLHQPGWWELPELRRLVPTEVAAAFDADYGKVSTHEHRPRSNPFLS